MAQVQLINMKENIDLSEFTLIIPTISVGNVPQLTIDLVITSMQFEKIATIWHPAIIGAVGADPYEENGPEICTACELYVNQQLKMALIQLRSTIDFKLATSFFQQLKESIIDLKFKEILILASSFDHELHVISNNKFYYISNDPKLVDTMKSINVKPKELEFNNKYFVHGSGFAVKLYEMLKECINCTVLIKFVSEGDNRPDAVAMLETISKFVSGMKKFDVRNIRVPHSWNCLFGGPPPIGIY